MGAGSGEERGAASGCTTDVWMLWTVILGEVVWNGRFRIAVEIKGDDDLLNNSRGSWCRWCCCCCLSARVVWVARRKKILDIEAYKEKKREL